MQSARRSFVNLLMAALVAGCPLAGAVVVTSLYVVMVPGADPQQAAQSAMRVELVRLTGTREAASDPALMPLIDNAQQYVQLERTTTSGEVQVLFDEPALSAAIGAAGRSLWGADRPMLWIELPQQDGPITTALRARLTAAAQERGLPITTVMAGTVAAASPAPAASAAPAVSPAPAAVASAVPAAAPAAPAGSAAAPAAGAGNDVSTAPAPPAVARSAAPPSPPAAAATSSAPSPPGGAAAPTPVPAPGQPAAPAASPPTPPGSVPLTPQMALDAARSAGASAALIAQLLPDNPGSLQWTLVSADTGGQWVGGPELAIDNATDMLSSAARALAQAPEAQYDCQIVGVNDLPSLVNVLAAVHSAPGVTDAVVSDVSGDVLTLHVQARGSGVQIERALASERLQPTGPGSNGLLEYRYVVAP